MSGEDGARQLERLAKRAHDLDDMIAKTAKMQKRIVEEIKRIGMRDRLKRQRMTATRKARRRKKPRG